MATSWWNMPVADGKSDKISLFHITVTKKKSKKRGRSRRREKQLTRWAFTRFCNPSPLATIADVWGLKI